ncbi:hypothetical protein RND71_023914 [Anisodus tanguticus]|uniref:Uncharacterized protein n=1 Tax=Anisodus tanguticus TaxID=243964 RepID=A0AAE1RTI4_9SOLA|nr:hypothetical protein RND71_023914 [Anisodus tanguticus]
MMLATVVYHIWKEKNMSVFQQKQLSVQCIVKLIIQEIYTRAGKQAKLTIWLNSYNFYPV